MIQDATSAWQVSRGNEKRERVSLPFHVNSRPARLFGLYLEADAQRICGGLEKCKLLLVPVDGDAGQQKLLICLQLYLWLVPTVNMLAGCVEEDKRTCELLFNSVDVWVLRERRCLALVQHRHSNLLPAPFRRKVLAKGAKWKGQIMQSHDNT